MGDGEFVLKNLGQLVKLRSETLRDRNLGDPGLAQALQGFSDGGVRAGGEVAPVRTGAEPRARFSVCSCLSRCALGLNFEAQINHFLND